MHPCSSTNPALVAKGRQSCRPATGPAAMTCSGCSVGMKAAAESQVPTMIVGVKIPVSLSASASGVIVTPLAVCLLACEWEEGCSQTPSNVFTSLLPPSLL